MRAPLVVGIAAIGVCLASPVAAQAPGAVADWPVRPYGGIYGGNPANSAGLRHSFDTTFQIGGGYERNKGSEGLDVGFGDPLNSLEGPFAGLGATLGYAWRGRRFSFGASGSTRNRYQQEMGDTLNIGQSGGVGFNATLGPRTEIRAQQTAATTPLFSINSFPVLGNPGLGQAAPPSADMALASRGAQFYGTTAGVTRGFGSRSSLALDYRLDDSRYTDVIQNLRSHALIVRNDYRLSPSRSVAPLYTFRDMTYGDGQVPPIQTHDVGAGFDQQWVHSRSRRTTLRVNAGATLVDTLGEQIVRPVGAIELSSMVGQSWTFRANYTRGIQAIPGLADATDATGFGASADGLLTERLDLVALVGVARGEVGFGTAPAAYESFNASVRLGAGITRTLAAFSEVFYYWYDDTAGTVVPGVSGRLDRYGVRAGLSVWVPIVRRRQQS